MDSRSFTRKLRVVRENRAIESKGFRTINVMSNEKESEKRIQTIKLIATLIDEKGNLVAKTPENIEKIKLICNLSATEIYIVLEEILRNPALQDTDKCKNIILGLETGALALITTMKALAKDDDNITSKCAIALIKIIHKSLLDVCDFVTQTRGLPRPLSNLQLRSVSISAKLLSNWSDPTDQLLQEFEKCLPIFADVLSPAQFTSVLPFIDALPPTDYAEAENVFVSLLRTLSTTDHYVLYPETPMQEEIDITNETRSLAASLIISACLDPLVESPCITSPDTSDIVTMSKEFSLEPLKGLPTIISSFQLPANIKTPGMLPNTVCGIVLKETWNLYKNLLKTVPETFVDRQYIRVKNIEEKQLLTLPEDLSLADGEWKVPANVMMGLATVLAITTVRMSEVSVLVQLNKTGHCKSSNGARGEVAVFYSLVCWALRYGVPKKTSNYEPCIDDCDFDSYFAWRTLMRTFVSAITNSQLLQLVFQQYVVNKAFCMPKLPVEKVESDSEEEISDFEEDPTSSKMDLNDLSSTMGALSAEFRNMTRKEKKKFNLSTKDRACLEWLYAKITISY